jgi:flagellar assembly protein FliH
MDAKPAKPVQTIMPSVIKTYDQNRGVQRVAFNFDDMAVKAGEYLEKIKAEAAEIVAKAKREATAIRQQAEAEGRRSGQLAVEQMVQKQLSQQLSTLLPALRQAVQDIQHAKQAWLRHWEKNSVHLAAAIAARVIRRELASQPDIPVKLIREALELAVGGTQVRVHLNPADHATLNSQIQLLVREISGLGPTEIAADPAVAPGGCRVETRFGTIDQQFEAQLARIEEELT